MRTPEPYIFNLIKDLSKGEKDDVVRFVRSTNQNPIYLDLFRVLDSMEKFDEEELKSNLPATFPRQHLSRYKNYLYEVILWANARIGESRVKSPYSLLEDIKFLKERGQVELCLRRVSKLQTEARAKELFHLERIALEEEKELLSRKETTKAVLKRKEEIQARIETLVEQEKLAQRLKDDHQSIIYRIREKLLVGTPRENAIESEVWGNFAKRFPKATSKSQFISRRAELFIFYIKAALSTLMGEFESALSFKESLRNLYEGHPFLIEENFDGYLVTLRDLANLSAIMGKKRKFKETFERLNSIQVPNPFLERQKKDKVFRVILSLGPNSDFVPHGVYQIGSIEEFYLTNLPHFDYPKQVLTCFLIGKFFLENNELNRSRRWLKEIVDQSSGDIRQDLQIISRILLLLIFLRQKDFERIDLYNRKFLHFFSKKHPFANLGKTFQKFVNLALENSPKQAKALEEIENELQKKGSPDYRPYFDFDKWVKENRL